MTRKPNANRRKKRAAPRKPAAELCAVTAPSKAVTATPAVTAAVDPQPDERPVDFDFVVENQSQPKRATTPRKGPSALCCLLSMAFTRASSGTVRAQLRCPGQMAVVLLVPSADWIEPVRSLFLARYDGWESCIAYESKVSATMKATRAAEVAEQLACGTPVVGIAAHGGGLPTVLVNAADRTIRMAMPDAATIGRAIRMFTGEKSSIDIDDAMARRLELNDLVAAFRRGSSSFEIADRLRKAATAQRGTGSGERLPLLEDAVEYGEARTWGLALARDIADFKAGVITWDALDRGAVLFSEPGLGKSLYARILAEACAVPLVAFSIADLFAEGAGYLDSVIKSSRSMFERAAALASPCCIKFSR